MMLIVPLLAVFVHSARSAVDYCEKDLQCNVGGATIPHSMCNPKREKKCWYGKSMNGSAEMEREVLKFHNDIRASLSSKEPPFGLPRACPLRDLEWDSELAAIASSWAINQCSMKIDPCRNMKDQGRVVAVGQNIAVVQWLFKTPETPLATILGYWWNMMAGMELRNRGRFIAKYQKGIWDPAAQMILADSRKIGCAYVQFDLQIRRGHFVTLVCNYASGITPGTQVYGRLFGNCPSGERKGPEIPVPTIPKSNDMDVILFDTDGKKIFPLKLRLKGSRAVGDDVGNSSTAFTHLPPSEGYKNIVPPGRDIGTKLSVSLVLHSPILLLMFQLVK